MNNLDFTSLEGKKIIVGGAKGKLNAKLVGFTTEPDRLGRPNYKFDFELVDYEGADLVKYRTGFINSAISSIARQYGVELGQQVSAEEVLTRAANEGLTIWINDDRKVFFSEPTISEQSEEAGTF